jgi:hypothetical protein
LDFKLDFEHDDLLLELELFEVELLLIICKTKVRGRVLTALKLLLGNGNAKAGLTDGGLWIEFTAKTIFEGAHYTTAVI